MTEYTTAYNKGQDVVVEHTAYTGAGLDVGSPSVSDGNTVCALSDESA